MAGGLNVDPDPTSEQKGRAKLESPPQAWPGSDADLRPQADHGEDSYVGTGKLKDRVALVTGADSGIGRAVALAFAREGADVAIAYYDEHADAKETLRWVEKAGRRGILIPGDLQDPARCREAVERTVGELGRLNLLVNNIAYHLEQDDVQAITPEQLDRTFRTNVYSYFWTTQAALPHLREGDSILNTGSVTGLRGSDTLIDYAATKAAVHSFTKSLAQHLSGRGIRVNAVSPGPVWTPLIPATKKPEKVHEHGHKTAWKRAAQPAEIAPSFVFLASADGRYYTGEILAPTASETTR